MSQLFFGSICLTDLIELAKKKHSAFTKGNNGKIYASVNVWLNDKSDKYGNIMSVQVNPAKDMKDLEDRVYIGNLKQSDGPKPVSDRDISDIDADLNIDTYKAPPPAGAAGIAEPIDDLPF